MTRSLDDKTYERVMRLCAEGDALARVERYDDAIAAYHEAWALLPEPKRDWEAAFWIASAEGDAYFLSGRYPQARRAFAAAMEIQGPGNPFIHLRLGQCHFEEGQMPRAADELTRAYTGGGRAIFDGEDRKYLDYLRTVLLPPVGQDDL